MKNKFIAASVSAFVFALSFSPIIPVQQVSAQITSVPTPVCPVGYICTAPTTPVVSTPPSTGTPITPAVPPTATVGNTALLTLALGQNKESALNATFVINVTGGSNGVNVNKYGVGVVFYDQKGNAYDNLDSESVKVNAPSGIATAVDAYNQGYYVVPANKTIAFTVVATVNPQQMFGGIYYAQLGNGLLVDNTLLGSDQYNLTLQKANVKTNTALVFGESTPYINPTVVTVAAGKPLVVTGQRLGTNSILPIVARNAQQNSTVYIDGAQVPQQSVSFGDTGMSMTVKLPSSVGAGAHTIYVADSSKQKSNLVAFNVTGSVATTSAPVSALVASVDASSPLAGIVQVAATTTTPNIIMGVFDVEAQNTNATLQNVNVTLNTSGGNSSVGMVFSNIQLKIGGLVVGSGTIANPSANSSAINFTNLNISLPSNTWVPITISTTVAGGVSGTSANVSFSLPGTNAAYTAATQQFMAAGSVLLSNESFSISPAQSTNNGMVNVTTFNGSFTVTAGNAPIYISANTTALPSSNNGSALTLGTNSASLIASVTNFVPQNGSQSYDTATTYQITPGSSRTFTFSGSLTNTSSKVITAAVGVSAVNFASAPVSTNLQGLNSDFHIQTLLGGKATVAYGATSSFSLDAANVWTAALTLLGELIP